MFICKYYIGVISLEIQKIRPEQIHPNDNRYTTYGEEVLGYSLDYLERITATEGQTVFTIGRNYANGDPNNKLRVFINGIKQQKDVSFLESGSNTITFTEGLSDGDIVRVRIGAVGGTVTKNKHYHVADEIPPEIADGTNRIFSLEFFPKTNTECVFLNGILMCPGNNNDYVIVGTIVTLNNAPTSGSKITFSYLY